MTPEEAAKLSGCRVRLRPDENGTGMPDTWQGEEAIVLGCWTPPPPDADYCCCHGEPSMALVIGWLWPIGWPIENDKTTSHFFNGTQGCISGWYIDPRQVEVVE